MSILLDITGLGSRSHLGAGEASERVLHMRSLGSDLLNVQGFCLTEKKKG